MADNNKPNAGAPPTPPEDKPTPETSKSKPVETAYFKTVGTGTVTMGGIKFTQELSEPISDPGLIERARKFDRLIEDKPGK